MGKIKKILETELVGGTQSTDVYPVTSTKAVYDTDNKVLDNYIQHLKKTSTFAGIATPTTNPGTPNGNVFYIAGEGTYVNFSNLVIGVGQLGILKWDGTWSKQVLEIGAGGEGGGVVDTASITKIVNDTIKNVSWWGQNIDNNKVDGNIVITKGSHSFTIDLDDNGNLKFNGNIYATGGITALGVGSTSGSGSGVSLGTLLTKLNSDNPFPTDNGQVLTYDGSNFIWKIPTGSGDSSSSSNHPLTIYNGSSDTDYITYDGSSSTYLRFKSGFSISKVGLGYEISASGGGSGSSGTTTGSLYFGAQNKNLSFNGSTDMSLAFGDGLKVEKLYNQIIVSATGGGTGDSGVTLNPTMSAMNAQLGETTSNTPQFLYWDGSTYTWKNESEISSGSGSNSRINKIKLFNSSGSSFKTIELGTADTIGFMAGNNVSLEAVVKEYTNVIKISVTGSSGGSTSTSVSWTDVTNKPSTFTPSSHTHLTSDISGLANYVQGVKVSNATNADKATQLANSRTIWGQSFNGTSDINGNLKMGSSGGGSIQLWMNNSNMLERTNNILHIGNGLKASSDGCIYLDAYATKVYTDNMSKHYDFKSNVFDVNSNQIHFGTDSNGGTLSWDSENKCFKIDGSIYATGGITALGVSNNATTSNNFDVTFRSVTANTFNVMNSIQLSDGIKLNRNYNDIDLVSIDEKEHHLNLDGLAGFYYLSTTGEANFNVLTCDTLNIPGCLDFRIINVDNRSFTIKFKYGGRIYQFTPSGDNVTVS